MGSNSRNNQKDRRLKGTIVCYECNKSRHIKFECPDLEKIKRRIVGPKHDKRKVQLSTWEDMDTSDEEEEKLCLVARNVECSSGDSNEEIYFYNLYSVIHAYYELLSHSSKLSNTNKLLQK